MNSFGTNSTVFVARWKSSDKRLNGFTIIQSKQILCQSIPSHMRCNMQNTQLTYVDVVSGSLRSLQWRSMSVQS